MKANWKTTLAATIAAIAQALQATGALPPPWGMITQLVEAAALAALGYSAADRTPAPPVIKGP